MDHPAGTKLFRSDGLCPAQVSKYVEREILNHKRLIHPHIVQLKEVFSQIHSACIRHLQTSLV